MNSSDMPLVSTLADTGAEDPVFDSLLVIGPLVVLVLAVLGRSTFTEGLAAAYIGVFPLYVLYQAVR